MQQKKTAQKKILTKTSRLPPEDPGFMPDKFRVGGKLKRRIFGIIGVARCSISRISDDGVVLWTCEIV